jgi:hypothetical protein
MVGLAFAALCVGGILSSAVPGSAVVWAGAVCAVLVGRVIAHAAYAERATLLASTIAIVLAVPALFFAASCLPSTPLVLSRADYSGPSFNEAFNAVVALAPSIVVAPLVAFPLAWKPRRGVDHAMRGLAYATLVAAALLAAAATLRAAHHHAPPDGYVASLPLIATLGDGDGATADGDRIHLARHAAEPGKVNLECAFDVTLTEKDGRGLDQVFQSGARSACERIGVRRDDANGYWVFTDETNAKAPDALIAIDFATHQNQDLVVATVVHSLAAPPAWIALAALGAAVAAAGLAWGRRRLAPLRERLAAIEATHLGGGSVRLGDDVPPFLVDRAAALPLGPVLLVGATRAAAEGYRTSGVPLAPRDVVPGSLADASRTLACASASQHAYALACAAIAASPLAAAAFAHLVF